MKTVLSIAGSDCSGGAGIQADLKTIAAHGLYGMTAVTALTAQNTLGVRDIMTVTPEFLACQLDCIFQDIVPDAVKIGMVASGELIGVLAEKLQQYRARHIVVDPVMISTSGSALLKQEAMESLIERLLPLAEVITPNIPEAEVLSQMKLPDHAALERGAAAISRMTAAAVLLKGGHGDSTADDLLYQNGRIEWLLGERIDNPNTHGTGCTLSSAIACGLAQGKSLSESVREAKQYLTGALRFNMNLGQGSGPLHHMYRLGEDA